MTYGQLPQELTPESVISQLHEKIEFIHYVLGIEDGGTNVYVVLISEKRLDIRDGSIFDIKFCNETHKCRCEGIRDLSKTVRKDC